MMAVFFTKIKEIYAKHRRAVSFFFLAGIILLLWLYLRDKPDEFSSLFRLSFRDIIILVACSLFFKLTWGYIFRVLLLFFELRLSFREWFGLTNIAAMTNYFLPAKGGLVPVAVYLKKTHSFNYTEFLSSLTGFYGITFLVNAVVGMALSLLVLGGGPFYGDRAFLFFTAVTIVFLVPFVAMRFSHRIKNAGIFGKFVGGLRCFLKRKEYLPELVLTQVVLIAAIGFRMFFAFRALGIELGFVPCALIALIACFSMLLSITPANLGIKEFFITVSGPIFGVTPEEALMAAIIDRCIDVVLSFALGGAFVYTLTRGRVRIPEGPGGGVSAKDTKG